MKRILGLDLGTNSIGWALENKKLHRVCGVKVQSTSAYSLVVNCDAKIQKNKIRTK